MANQHYIISEVKFFQENDKEETKAFLSGTGIDLDKSCHSITPTLLQIEENITAFGLTPKRNINEIEVTTYNDEVVFHLIFDSDTIKETKVFMFEIGWGSNFEVLIDFIKFLGHSFGNFLLYCDSGQMALITKEKSTEQILQIYHT